MITVPPALQVYTLLPAGVIEVAVTVTPIIYMFALLVPQFKARLKPPYRLCVSKTKEFNLIGIYTPCPRRD